MLEYLIGGLVFILLAPSAFIAGLAIPNWFCDMYDKVKEKGFLEAFGIVEKIPYTIEKKKPNTD